jgi:hypothetical protein
MAKKQKAKSNYDDEEEGEWVEEREASPEGPAVMAVPAAALVRTSTCIQANPTPPTNVPVVYQGSPPTTTGLTPAQAPAPDVAAANIILFSDPLNGATARSAVVIPTLPATTPAAELAGKAEFSGLTSKVDAAHGRLTVRGIAVPAYSETPNAGHPSYGT